MNQHFLNKCYRASIFDEELKLDIISTIILNKQASNLLSKNCLGFASDQHQFGSEGFLISKSHSQLSNNILKYGSIKEATGLRSKHIKLLRFAETLGIITLTGKTISFEDIIPVVGQSIRITVDKQNNIIIPPIFSYKEWIDIAKLSYPDDFNTKSPLKRQQVILKTIRHSIGIYDATWQALPSDCYGFVCRKFVQMICKHYPPLDTVAKSWLESKAKIVNVDQFELNSDFLVGSDKFYWIPETWKI